MKKQAIFTLIIALILVLSVSFTMIPSKGNYVKLLPYTYSHTKAICNTENLCRDYEIFCEDQKVMKMSPITGKAVQFSADWEDPRDEEKRNKIC